MNDLQKQFEAELTPLLLSVEQSIIARSSQSLLATTERAEKTADIIMLVDKYMKAGLNREQLREVMNGPTATAIARRLGAIR